MNMICRKILSNWTSIHRRALFDSSNSVCFRHLGTSSNQTFSRHVLVSRSQCIFENLALEDWLYLNAPLAQSDYLLLWRNKPAVVVGKHQNPWVEANIQLAKEKGINIARRASGGGTVYHDLGNLNLSFLTSRDRYNRRRNLELVVEALKECGDADIIINKRDDIILDTFYKISGTASKLGRTQSYHHFTLLHSLDLASLHNLLKSSVTGVTSRATQSAPALVKNLVDELPLLTFQGMIDAVSQHFLQADGTLNDVHNHSLVDPTDESKFPGVGDLSNQLKSWAWIYGKTPKFSIQRQFTGYKFQDQICTVDVDVTIEKGKVLDLSLNLVSGDFGGLIPFTVAFYREHLVEEELTRENLLNIKQRFDKLCDSAFMDRSSEVYRGAQWLQDQIMECLHFV